jgi:hypothetical protein
MRRLIIILPLACLPLAAAAAPDPLQECKLRYTTAQRELWIGSIALQPAQQAYVRSVLEHVRSSYQLLKERGLNAYPQLCTADMLEALDRVQVKVKAMQPPPLANVEADAERSALLKAAAEFLAR